MPKKLIEKSCKNCNIVFPRSEFVVEVLRNKCKVCNKIKVQKERIELKKVHEDARIRNIVKIKCKGCGKTKEDGAKLVYHHIHGISKVECVLCNDCNLGISKFEDNPVKMVLVGESIHNNIKKEDEVKEIIKNECQGCGKMKETETKIISNTIDGTDNLECILCNDCNLGVSKFEDDPIKMMLISGSIYFKIKIENLIQLKDCLTKKEEVDAELKALRALKE